MPRAATSSEADLVVPLVRGADLLERDLAAGAQVVERSVPRHAQDPGGERHLARLIPVDRGDQLREDVLGDVLGLVVVADDAPDEAADVVGVANVEEVQRAAIALL
jgi:hypothetical protein